MAPLLLTLWTLTVLLCTALSTVQATNGGLQPRIPVIDDPNVELIYQFAPGIGPENAALRSNGQLLVTCLTCNFITQLDPNLGPTQEARTVYTFPAADVINVLGIAELERDVFAVVTGQVPINLDNITTVPTPKGPPSIWILDIRGYQAPTYNSSAVHAVQVLSKDTGGLWDGLTIINASRGLLATTDFLENNIYLIDIPSQTSSILVSGTGLGGQVTTSPPNLGMANGLKYHNGTLYFTASLNGTYGYLPVNSHTGKATGPVQVAYQYGFTLDDFAFGPRTGNTYFTTLLRPEGGIIRRLAGTPKGQSGSMRIVDYFGTNAVIPRDVKGGMCQLLFTVVLRFQVARVTVPGPC